MNCASFKAEHASFFITCDLKQLVQCKLRFVCNNMGVKYLFKFFEVSRFCSISSWFWISEMFEMTIFDTCLTKIFRQCIL